MRQFLSRLSSLADIRALFERLGYRGADDLLDDIRIVARWKGFQVAAVVNPEPHEAVRTLARHLSGFPGRSLAVALAPRRCLAVAAPRLGTAGVTPVLLVDLQRPTADSVQTLGRCRPTARTGLAHAVQMDNLLNSEVAGERFYAAFRILHREALDRTGAGATADRHLAALLPLLRVLFLYFVQAKGWLDGNPAFLRDHLDRGIRGGRRFQRDVLDPLCFGTLNHPLHRRGTHPFGAVPYLNGGLFERHPAERAVNAPALPNPWWRDAFDGVFERFRFCVREADQVGAIAPDMLGRVFERLMLPDERQHSGTFYTPVVIVDQMVNAALETALCGPTGLPARIGHALVRTRRVDPEWAGRARAALNCLRVLDPAVGSGAFLLGVLAALTDLQLASAAHPPDARARLRLRKNILKHNLFGVDRNPVAVRLAELRLWLAVLADDPAREVHEVEPLPNLDGVVRQGDSLLDPIAAARALGTHPGHLPPRAVSRVAAARSRLYEARGDAYPRAVRTLRRAETALSRALLERARRDIAARLEDLRAAAESRTLFGTRTGLSASQRHRRKALLQQQHTLDREIAAARADQSRFFSFESHVPDVMRDGGFSVVIGNPPWVRSERLPPDLRRALKGRFRWWQASSRAGFNPLPDLSVAFLERGIELLRPGGALGLLLPRKLTTAAYAETARTGLVRETTVRYVHRVPPAHADLFRATTYPLALVLRNTPPDRRSVLQLDFDGRDRLAQRHLRAAGPWVLVSDPVRRALEDLRTCSRSLGDLGPARLGVKTGANAIFLGRAHPRRGGVTVRTGAGSIDLPYHCVRPAIRGRDVKRFRVAGSEVILWPFTGAGQPIPFSALPPQLAEHFARHRARLAQRSDGTPEAYWLPHRLAGASGSHRVTWPDLSGTPRAVALDQVDRANAVPLNTCYVFAASTAEEALVIAAVFNSRWAHALALATAAEARGGYRRINAAFASTLPMPGPGTATSALAEVSLHAHEGLDVPGEEIDEAVADALELPVASRSTLRAFVDRHR